MIFSYRRVSTNEQHNGPQAQEEAITRWRHNNCPDTPYHDFFDNGVSGSVPFAERPEGAKLVAALEAEGYHTIVVSKLDRLFRSVSDASVSLDLWSATGRISLVAVAEGFDMTTPYGRAMAQMASVFAELERAMIRERTKAAMSNMKSRGVYIGGRRQYGVQLVDGALVADPVEDKIARNILMLRAGGLSCRRIATRLNKAGIMNRNGQPWAASSIHDICTRRANS